MNKIKYDTTNSDKIVQTYQNQAGKLLRFRNEFSGTWKTDLDTLFTLLCPAREADFIPGWEAEILHSDARGYMSNKAIWRTDKDNIAGEGIWVTAQYEKNRFVEIVKVNYDFVLNLRIDVKDNKDGTVTGTWNVVISALNEEEGNKAVKKMKKTVASERKAIPKVIEYYLKTGKKINKASLTFNVASGLIKNKISKG